MTIANREALRAFRNDPLHLVLAVEGLDLTNAPIALCVRQRRDTPGSPILQLDMTATAGAKGIRLVSVTPDDDGIPTSLVEILCPKADMIAAFAAYQPAEFGADLTLAYDLQWTLAPDGTGLTNVEETILFGDFIIQGSVNG